MWRKVPVEAKRYVRTGGALGHLLLVVVLAVGVLVMHTIGHPHDSSPTAMDSGGAAHGQVSMAAEPGARAEPLVMGEVAKASSGMSPSQVKDHASLPDRPPASHAPVKAMDMASLCMAVLLSAWLLVALVRAALARRPEWLSRLLARGPVLPGLDPPPRGPSLMELSVLRL